MFISDKIVYVELPKTASCYIDELLMELVDGKKVGKHNYPDNKLFDSGKKFIGSVRNPWEWYLSLWAYGCQYGLKSGVFSRATSYDVFRLKGYGFSKNPMLASRSFVKRVLFSTNRERNVWKYSYRDVNSRDAFREWLHLMFDNKHIFQYNALFDQSSIRDFAGLYSYRYCFLHCKRRNELFSRKLSSIDALKSWEDKNCYIDYFINTQSLEHDFVYALRSSATKLSETDINRVFSKKKTNTTKKRGLDYYYDDESADLVRARESLIIDKFGYKFLEK